MSSAVSMPYHFHILAVQDNVFPLTCACGPATTNFTCAIPLFWPNFGRFTPIFPFPPGPAGPGEGTRIAGHHAAPQRGRRAAGIRGFQRYGQGLAGRSPYSGVFHRRGRGFPRGRGCGPLSRIPENTYLSRRSARRGQRKIHVNYPAPLGRGFPAIMANTCTTEM